jgi:hypothetical protein
MKAGPLFPGWAGFFCGQMGWTAVSHTEFPDGHFLLATISLGMLNVGQVYTMMIWANPDCVTCRKVKQTIFGSEFADVI